jgi:hypothetical protein
MQVAGKLWRQQLGFRAQYRVYLLVESGIFSQFFLMCILTNTLLLAMEYDGMPPSMEEGLQVGERCEGWGVRGC